jgi:prepilin signal peptidase PulO-like enzyme (type II secretory pathway)
MVVPFGPWLSLGAIVYIIFMRDSVDSYFNAVGSLLSW